MYLTTKRTLTALAGLAAGMALLAGCTTAGPTPSGSPSVTPTPTPTATSISGEAPTDEDEAITKAEATIELLMQVNAEVSAAGGTDPTPYESVATGKALEFYKADAAGIANGPTLNADGKNIDGPATVEGSLVFEPKTAYGQEWKGVANGLVIVPGCLDNSGRIITAADGSPAMKNPKPRNEVEMHVIYDAEQRIWLVNDQISLGTTC